MDLIDKLHIDKFQSAKPQDCPILAILGPTASGKTALSLKLAQQLPVEIISADSMQFYKEMNIGVAKPTKEEQKLIPHHLIDIRNIHEKVDIYQFVELAEKAIKKIRNNNHIPLIVGGSGLYIRSLFYGLDPLPADEKLRQKLDEKFDSESGFEQLKEIMQQEDPQSFKRWSKHKRKLIRAYEVFKLTGTSITELQKTWKGSLRFPVQAWRICMERQLLRERIALRTDEMLNNGWIEETQELIKIGFLESPTAKQAIGYKIISEYLAGNINKDEMRTKIINSTRQYARRQDTWFKNQHPEAIPLEI